MGANRTEYENSFRNNSAKDLKNNVDESKLGTAYQKRMGKMMLPGAIAPMAGMIGSSTLQEHAGTLETAGNIAGSQDFSNYADMALGAGSALGAVAAPLMYRSATKQNASNASDMNDRSKALNKGQRMSASQKADTALNAGTAVQKAGMGAVGTAYGANAASVAMGGSGVASGTQLIAASKLGGSLTPGMGGFNAYTASQGGNPFAAMSGGGTSEMFGDAFGGSTGMAMAAMMASGILGGKATKGIKSMANAGGKEKYKYRSPALNAPSPDRDLNKYNTLGTSFGAQVNLLMMTDKLSPYENLALTALSAIAKNTGAGPALFQFLTGKEDMGSKNRKLAHNKLAGALGQEDEFSSLSGHTKAGKKGSIEQLITQYSTVMDSIDKTILGVSKGIQAGATALNPLNILFGGLFGPSAEKQISGLFGLDEESIRDNAVERTAKNLNLPVAMVAIAETRADKILMMAGDDPDSKKIAILQFIAEINRNQLMLMLEEKTKDSGGFIGKTQEQFEIMDTSSGVEGALKKFRGLVGNVPGLGLIASVLALQEAREKNKEDTARKLMDDLDYQQGRKDDSLSHEALANSFLGTEFPLLFLETMDLDVERNILLTELRDMVEQHTIGNDSSAMKARRSMYPREKNNNTWDMVTGSIMSNQEADENKSKDFEKNKAEIIEFFKEAMLKHPYEKKQIKKRKEEELAALSTKYKGSELSLQEGKDKENDKKRENLLTNTLVKLEKWISGGSSVSGSSAPGKTGSGSLGMDLKNIFAGGGTLKGKLWSAGKATLMALKSVLQMAVQSRSRVLIGGVALAYLGYRLSKTEFGQELGRNIKSGFGKITKIASELGLSAGDVAGGVARGATALFLGSIFRDIYMSIPAKNRKLKLAVGVMALVSMGGTLGIFKKFEGKDLAGLISSLPGVGNLITSLGVGSDTITENDKAKASIKSIIEFLGMGLVMAPHPIAKVAGAVLLLGVSLSDGSGRRELARAIASGRDELDKMIRELVPDFVLDATDAFDEWTGAKTGNQLESLNEQYKKEDKARAKRIRKENFKVVKEDSSSKAFFNNMENSDQKNKLLALQKKYDEMDGTVDDKIDKKNLAKYQNAVLALLNKQSSVFEEEINSKTNLGAFIEESTIAQSTNIRNLISAVSQDKAEHVFITSVKGTQIKYSKDSKTK